MLAQPQILTSAEPEYLVLARHFETAKNLHDIHGASDLSDVTDRGHQQAREMVRYISLNYPTALEGVVATPTPQAISSARIVARLLNLPYEGELKIMPLDLG